MSKKHQNLSFFWPFCHFWGDILSFWKWKKSQKNWHNSRKSPKNFFSDFCTKSVKNYPKELTFAVFFYRMLLKKKDATRVESILSWKFKDALRWNPYDYVSWWRFLKGLFNFFSILMSTFWKIVSPISFRKPQGFFNWKRKSKCNWEHCQVI